MGTPPPDLMIDVGNSGVKTLVYRGSMPEGEVVRFANNDWEAIDRWVTNLGVENIIYSSVANVPTELWIAKWKAENRRVFGLRDLPLPFTTEYTTPETLGQDRIAAIAGTLGLVSGPRLIVDAGSCITADLVDGEDHHRGGNISPGLGMRLRAMHEFTDRLPLVTGEPEAGEIGIGTTDALLHGGRLGAAYEISGLFSHLRTRHPELRLVLTGGDAGWLAKRLSVPILHYPHLVLRGLHQIMSNYVN